MKPKKLGPPLACEDIEEGPLLTPAEASAILRVSLETLRDWRKRASRSGPSFVKVGRGVRYFTGELARYIRKRRVKVPVRKGRG